MNETNIKPYEVTPIEPGKKRGWDILVNGEEIEGVESVRLVNNRLNMSVDYGMRPEGYDGFVIRELGGAVTVPYMVDPDGQIYIGLVSEFRPTTGEANTDNVPRGMGEFGEDHATTANRELAEETGYNAQKSGKQVVKLAENLNVNSTFFDNSRQENKGVSIYGVQIDSNELTLDHDDDGNVFYAFPDSVAREAKNDAAEKIYGSKFVPLTEATQSKDMFTVSAVSLLTVQLLSDGNYIVPQTTTYTR